MAQSSLNSRWLLLALPLLGAVSGCWCQAFPLPAEDCCPTDARHIYCGVGEEAVRRGPCGPNREFYGHKPTDWRAWPEGWRYGQYPCSAPGGDYVNVEPPPAAPQRAGDVANPFRNDDAAEHLPATEAPAEAPPADPNSDDAGDPNLAPTKSTPSETAPSENQDGKSAATADEATQPAPLELPPEEATPAPTAPAPAPAPPAEAVPIDSAATAPPANTEENKSTSAGGSRLKLIAAQNVAPPAEPQSNAAAKPPVAAAPAKVPAAAWGGRPKTKVVQAGAEEPPVSKRVAEHLTHTLMN